MKPRRPRWFTTVAVVAYACSLALLVATAWLLTRNGLTGELSPPDLAMALTYPAVGAVLVARRPDNRIGQLLLLAGLSAAIQVFSTQYALYALHVRHGAVPGGVWMLWVSGWIWVPAFTSLALFLVLLFPTGRVPSVRWRPVAWFNAALVVALLLVSAVRPGHLANAVTEPPNPLGVSVLAGSSNAVNVLFILGLISMLACVVRLVLRFRGAGTVERAQLKWFVFAAALAAGTLFVDGISAERVGAVFDVLSGVGVAAVAVAVGIAITRYRLYDIDRLISRTVSYAVITALLVAVYVAAVTLGTRLAPGGSSIAVAASTLAVAALFHPLRRAVQVRVDRQFNRARYDAERTVDSFSRRLREETDIGAVRADLLGVVGATMQPMYADVWLPERGSR